MSEHEIIFSQQGQLGTIELNRPKALNALSQEMCRSIFQKLGEWECDDSIKAVLIKGRGDRAFCAGGDIRALYDNPESMCQHPHPFFWDEYRMNARLFHFKKPYISFMDGITMGGGIGVSLHGSHCVATEQLMLAMPETGIGFFPDIGASYHLTRLPGRIGWYLGITGNAIGAADAYRLGIANCVVPSTLLDELEKDLMNTPIESHEDVDAILKKHHHEPDISELLDQQEFIDAAFSAESIPNIRNALANMGDPWCTRVANTLLTRSPTSTAVTLEQFNRASRADFDDIIKTDFDIAQHFLEGHDFLEGIRAAIIDKDNRPKWKPKKTTSVKQDMIEEYFTPMCERLDLSDIGN